MNAPQGTPSLLQLLLGTLPVESAPSLPAPATRPFAPILDHELAELQLETTETDVQPTLPPTSDPGLGPEVVHPEVTYDPTDPSLFADPRVLDRIVTDIVGLPTLEGDEAAVDRPAQSLPRSTAEPLASLPTPLPLAAGPEELVLRPPGVDATVPMPERIVESEPEAVTREILARLDRELGASVEDSPRLREGTPLRPLAIVPTPMDVLRVNVPSPPRVGPETERAVRDLGRIVAMQNTPMVDLESIEPIETPPPAVVEAPRPLPGRTRPAANVPRVTTTERPAPRLENTVEPTLAPIVRPAAVAGPAPVMPSLPIDSLQTEVLARVAEVVEDTAKDALLSSVNEAEATVRINPARLGPLHVHVRLDQANQSHVTVQAMEAAAFEMLEGEAEELIESMLAQRLDLAEFNLTGSGGERATPRVIDSEPNLSRDFHRQTRQERPDSESRPRPRGRSSHQGEVDLQA